MRWAMCAAKTVVEIGPEKARLRGRCASRAAHVIAVELDRGLAGGFAVRIPCSARDSDRGGRAARSISRLAAGAGKRLAVAGNLPYYITSPILLKLAQSHAVLDRAVLMVQREVADRMVAAPGSRRLRRALGDGADVRTCGTALYSAAGAFSPPPDVHSTVFRWRFSPRFAELKVDAEDFLISCERSSRKSAKP